MVLPPFKRTAHNQSHLARRLASTVLTNSSFHYQHHPILCISQTKSLIQFKVPSTSTSTNIIPGSRSAAQSRLNTESPEKARVNLTHRSPSSRSRSRSRSCSRNKPPYYLLLLSFHPPSLSSTHNPQIMNGSQIKQAAIQKAKQVASTASASNGNSNKKRKKELKPIITTEGHQDAEMASSNQTSAG